MNLNPFKIIDRATKAVPSTKYAVGILGIIAVLALIKQFNIDLAVAFWGTIILLGLMILLVVFAKLSEASSADFKYPVKLMMWAFVLLFIFNCILLSSAAFLGWPKLHDINFMGKPISESTPSGLANTHAKNNLDQSDFLVKILRVESANDIAEQFRGNGLNVRMINDDTQVPVQDSASYPVIWIGMKVSSSNIARVIKLAHHYMPWLHYVCMQTDAKFENQILLGAHNSFVTDYGLKKLSSRDFLLLSNDKLDINTMHSLINLYQE